MICYAKALVAARMGAPRPTPASRPPRPRRPRFGRRRAAAAVVVSLGSVASPQLPGAPIVQALSAPQLVADVNIDGNGSDPTQFTRSGSNPFFVADHGVHVTNSGPASPARRR